MDKLKKEIQKSLEDYFKRTGKGIRIEAESYVENENGDNTTLDRKPVMVGYMIGFSRQKES